jgi:DNA (cytosine-5)-methyltransferase 1
LQAVNNGSTAVPAICFDTTQITSATNRSNPKPGDPCHPLAAAAHAPAIAFSSKDYGNDATADLSPTLRAMGHAGSHQNGGGQMAVAFHPSQDPISSTDGTTHAMGCGSSTGQASIAVAVALRGREGGSTAELGDEVQNCLRASSGGGDKPHVLAPVAFQPRHYSERERMGGEPSEICHTLSAAAGQGDSSPHVATAMQVRRLTPCECERLQGFPDGYTAIPWRKKPADQCPDGPRYKALGNSWAVPVVAWIGRRIHNAVLAAKRMKKEAA